MGDDQTMITRRGFFLAFFLVILCSSLVEATLVPRMTLEQAVDESAFIVQGTVVRAWSAWGDSKEFIWTHYELRVADALKGFVAQSIVISEPGGVVGDTGMQIAGAPRYSAGEEVVLFAVRTPIGYLRTAGWGQGKYVILDTAGSDRRIVRSSARDITAVTPISKTGLPLEAKQTFLGHLNGMELNAFKEKVKQLVVSRAAKGAR